MGVYDMSAFFGVTGAAQVDAGATGFEYGTLRGSAETALKDLGLYDQASLDLIAKLPDLYVVMVSRDYPTNWTWCLPISSAQIPYADPIGVMQRSYLKPGTTTGPSPDLLPDPHLIK
jgi:hypothetical protein